jgi:hypothetical protein
VVLDNQLLAIYPEQSSDLSGPLLACGADHRRRCSRGTAAVWATLPIYLGSGGSPLLVPHAFATLRCSSSATTLVSQAKPIHLARQIYIRKHQPDAWVFIKNLQGLMCIRASKAMMPSSARASAATILTRGSVVSALGRKQT